MFCFVRQASAVNVSLQSTSKPGKIAVEWNTQKNVARSVFWWHFDTVIFLSGLCSYESTATSVFEMGYAKGLLQSKYQFRIKNIRPCPNKYGYYGHPIHGDYGTLPLQLQGLKRPSLFCEFGQRNLLQKVRSRVLQNTVSFWRLCKSKASNRRAVTSRCQFPITRRKRIDREGGSWSPINRRTTGYSGFNLLTFSKMILVSERDFGKKSVAKIPRNRIVSQCKLQSSGLVSFMLLVRPHRRYCTSGSMTCLSPSR